MAFFSSFLLSFTQARPWQNKWHVSPLLCNGSKNPSSWNLVLRNGQFSGDNSQETGWSSVSLGSRKELGNSLGTRRSKSSGRKLRSSELCFVYQPEKNVCIMNKGRRWICLTSAAWQFKLCCLYPTASTYYTCCLSQLLCFTPGHNLEIWPSRLGLREKL